METSPLLQVEGLNVQFHTRKGALLAIKNIDFSIAPGEFVGIVGESGSGKSVTSLALMDLLANNAEIETTCFNFNGIDIRALSEKNRRALRGKEISMIFQDAMTSLNPCYTVGFQLNESLKIHGMDAGIANNAKNRKEYLISMLSDVGIPAPESRLHAFPHQLSGGMAQRVMIAMAISCRPKLLIADEPTTALDVTIQAQILELLQKNRRDHQMAVILISHDIGVIAEQADRIIVMYAGQIIETGPTMEVIKNPKHPYTEGLISSLPGVNTKLKHKEHLPCIKGIVPDLLNRPSGCCFHPRCPSAEESCRNEIPRLTQYGDREVACILAKQTT